MIFTDEEGNKWKWRGEYRAPEAGDTFLPNDGVGPIKIKHRYFPPDEVRAIVHPVAETFEDGGITWERMGKPRTMKEGEWFYSPVSKKVFRSACDTEGEYQIVRPVLSEGKE